MNDERPPKLTQRRMLLKLQAELAERYPHVDFKLAPMPSSNGDPMLEFVLELETTSVNQKIWVSKQSRFVVVEQGANGRWFVKTNPGEDHATNVSEVSLYMRRRINRAGVEAVV